jgi:hypothetical protein
LFHLFAFNFLAETEISNFEDAIVQEDVGWLEIAVDDVVPVEFLSDKRSTASPRMSCLSISMASSSSIAPRFSMKLLSVPCRQYSRTSILQTLF